MAKPPKPPGKAATPKKAPAKPPTLAQAMTTRAQVKRGKR